MNIDTSNNITQTKQTSTITKPQGDSDVKFSDELKSKASEKTEKKAEEKTDKKSEEKVEETKKTDLEETDKAVDNTVQKEADNAKDGLEDTLEEIKKLNRTDENEQNPLKSAIVFDEENRKHEELGLIDNNMNIQEPKDKIDLQMGSNTNFTGDGQPFAEFVNPEKSKDALKSSATDLAEEKAIMSTMEENIAIANKNMAMGKTKTVSDEHGVKKVDKNTNVTVDTIVSYDTILMDKSDVDFFLNLVENGVVDMKEVQNSQKSSAVSKTLADLLAKSMNENKPVRIDFDNNISIIIKISRDGKISADFLPSSQVAEAYLKENLPLLKQRFDEQNIEYGELNQRKQKQDNQDDRKKGRRDE